MLPDLVRPKQLMHTNLDFHFPSKAGKNLPQAGGGAPRGWTVTKHNQTMCARYSVRIFSIIVDFDRDKRRRVVAGNEVRRRARPPKRGQWRVATCSPATGHCHPSSTPSSQGDHVIFGHARGG